MAKKILVIGDTIIDKTVFTEAIGISLESPTLKTKLLSDEISYGGAANVAKNIARLGSECSFITIGEVDIPEVRTVSLPGTSAKKTRIWVHRRASDYRHLQINDDASGQNELLLQDLLKNSTFKQSPIDLALLTISLQNLHLLFQNGFLFFHQTVI